MKKGFTLVELLAVVVILALILAIAVPTITSLIATSKKNMFENSTKMIIKSMKNDYDGKIATIGSFTNTFILYDNGVRTVYPSGNALDFTISATDGGIVRHSDGTVTMALYDGTNCSVKTRTSNDVIVTAMDKATCLSNIIYKQATAPFTNLVANGDFSNGVTSWPGSAATATVSNGIYSLTANGTSNIPQSMQGSSIPVSSVTGHKLYMNAKLRTTNSSTTSLNIYFEGAGTQAVYVKANPVIDQWYLLSGIITKTGTTGNLIFTILANYPDAATAAGKTMQAQYVIGIDLTAAYGAGSEPTTADMDNNINKVWIDTVNSNTPKRLTGGGWINF